MFNSYFEEKIQRARAWSHSDFFTDDEAQWRAAGGDSSDVCLVASIDGVEAAYLADVESGFDLAHEDEWLSEGPCGFLDRHGIDWK